MRLVTLLDDGDLEPSLGEKTGALDTTDSEPDNKDPLISGTDIL
jgi:hypothetical protein